MNMENIIKLISGIMNNIFSFPVVIIIFVLMYKEEIREKIKTAKKITGHGFGAEFSESNKEISQSINEESKKQKQNEKQSAIKMNIHNIGAMGINGNKDGENDIYIKTQPVKIKFEDPKKSDNPKIAIPCIYDDIETAVKEQFEITDSPNMFINLLKEQKISNDTFDILESMKALRDSIHLTAQTQKITKQDINDYKENADGIIKIIKEIK